MTEAIAKREQYRLMMLKALYEQTNAGYWRSTPSAPFFNKMVEIGIPKCEVEQAFTWLEGEGYAAGVIIGGIGITHAGVRAYEATQSRPAHGTAEFPASVINQVFNFNAAVGGVQTSSHSTMNVEQQNNAAATSDVLALFDKLRAGLQELPPEKREEATEIVDAFQEQATAAKPKMALVKSYASTLNEYLLAYGPTIATLVDLCAKISG